MKTTRIIFCAVAAVCLSALAGCSRQQYRLYENNIGSKVYFVQAVSSPVLEVSEDDLDESGNVALSIYNAGNNSDNITVRVSMDENACRIYNIEQDADCQVLPQKYWSLPQPEFIMDTRENSQVYMPLKLGISSFRADGLNPEEYILPLTVFAGSTQNVTFDYKTIYVKLAL